MVKSESKFITEKQELEIQQIRQTVKPATPLISAPTPPGLGLTE